MSIYSIPIPYLIVYIIFVISSGDVISNYFYSYNNNTKKLPIITKIIAAISTIIVIIYTIYLYKIHGVI